MVFTCSWSYLWSSVYLSWIVIPLQSRTVINSSLSFHIFFSTDESLISNLITMKQMWIAVSFCGSGTWFWWIVVVWSLLRDSIKDVDLEFNRLQTCWRLGDLLVRRSSHLVAMKTPHPLACGTMHRAWWCGRVIATVKEGPIPSCNAFTCTFKGPLP